MDVNLNLQQAVKQARGQVTGALQSAAETLGQAADETTPYYNGKLLASRRVEVEGDEAAVTYDADYAADAHEAMDYAFTGNGRAKWLELTAEEQATALRDAFGAQVDL